MVVQFSTIYILLSVSAVVHPAQKCELVFVIIKMYLPFCRNALRSVDWWQWGGVVAEGSSRLFSDSTTSVDHLLEEVQLFSFLRAYFTDSK